MHSKIYYLSTCSTCQKIMKTTGITAATFELQDIKTEKISPEQLDAMKELAGNYEALFSRRSMQYAARGLKDQVLGEQDYRQLILEEYTFLKRPVIIIGNNIFIGNAAATVAAVQQRMKG